MSDKYSKALHARRVELCGCPGCPARNGCNGGESTRPTGGGGVAWRLVSLTPTDIRLWVSLANAFLTNELVLEIASRDDAVIEFVNRDAPISRSHRQPASFGAARCRSVGEKWESKHMASRDVGDATRRVGLPFEVSTSKVHSSRSGHGKLKEDAYRPAAGADSDNMWCY